MHYTQAGGIGHEMELREMRMGSSHAAASSSEADLQKAVEAIGSDCVHACAKQ